MGVCVKEDWLRWREFPGSDQGAEMEKEAPDGRPRSMSSKPALQGRASGNQTAAAPLPANARGESRPVPGPVAGGRGYAGVRHPRNA